MAFSPTDSVFDQHHHRLCHHGTSTKTSRRSRRSRNSKASIVFDAGISKKWSINQRSNVTPRSLIATLKLPSHTAKDILATAVAPEKASLRGSAKNTSDETFRNGQSNSIDGLPAGAEAWPKLKTMAASPLIQHLSAVSNPSQASMVAKAREEWRNTRVFDSAAFDIAIYQQAEAMKPPVGVVIPARSRQNPLPHLCQDQRYIHANPAIHLSHNRSEDWYKAMACEIRARGGRKAWFGKVIERQRWLRSQESNSQKPITTRNGSAIRRKTPQPWTYNRPLDFGDVAESQLPEDVRRNPDWLKACAWHREMHQARCLRQREAHRSEQETRQHYSNAVDSIGSASEL